MRQGGFDGQRFIAEVRRIREMSDLPKGADVGITAEITPPVVQGGAQVLVAVSAVYKGDPLSK